jgi:hypothetical protein
MLLLLDDFEVRDDNNIHRVLGSRAILTLEHYNKIKSRTNVRELVYLQDLLTGLDCYVMKNTLRYIIERGTILE